MTVCTILEYGELDKRVKDALVDFDFDDFMEKTELSYEKYVKSGVGEASQARAKAWLDVVRKDVEERKDDQRRVIEDHAPDWNYIKDKLDELREDWEAQIKIGWPGAWK